MATTLCWWPSSREHPYFRTPSNRAHEAFSTQASIHNDTSEQSLLLVTASATHQQEQAPTLKLLLEAGESVFQSDSSGNTCLHLLLGAVQPGQTWAIKSLIVVLRAGADSHHANYAGLTASDLACNAPPELGSFRRDVLLQALLETNTNISDVRLLRPTRLARSYTKMHHHLLFGDQSLHTKQQLRIELLDCLANALERQNIISSPRLQEAALDRILSSHAQPHFVNPAIIVRESLAYLYRMCECKKQIVAMSKERLPNHIWIRFGGSMNSLHMIDQAQAAALLEFDWLRPVDTEDVFSSYVDNLIEQIEDRYQGKDDVEIENLVEVLQIAIPSYRALSIRRAGRGAADFCRMADAKGHLQICTSEISVAEDRGRQESIVKTPIEFYPTGY